MNQIEKFNKIRRIVFSTFHKDEQGQIEAFSYLEGYKKKLGSRSYVGLKAELGFYQKYRKEFINCFFIMILEVLHLYKQS